MINNILKTTQATAPETLEEMKETPREPFTLETIGSALEFLCSQSTISLLPLFQFEDDNEKIEHIRKVWIDSYAPGAWKPYAVEEKENFLYEIQALSSEKGAEKIETFGQPITWKHTYTCEAIASIEADVYLSSDFMRIAAIHMHSKYGSEWAYFNSEAAEEEGEVPAEKKVEEKTPGEVS